MRHPGSLAGRLEFQDDLRLSPAFTRGIQGSASVPAGGRDLSGSLPGGPFFGGVDPRLIRRHFGARYTVVPCPCSVTRPDSIDTTVKPWMLSPGPITRPSRTATGRSCEKAMPLSFTDPPPGTGTSPA